MLKTILDCTAFLTLIPIRTEGELTETEMGRFPACYPVVGLILGFTYFILATLMGWAGLPVATMAVLLVISQAILTRGFHLDGLADCADALLSHKSLERKLEILKDSHQGTFGVLAIVTSFAVKATVLASLGAGGAIPPHLLLLFPIWGRLSASVVATLSKPLGSGGGLGYAMVAHSGSSELILAGLFSLIMSLAFGLRSFMCALLAIAVGYLLTKVWKAALGGVNGDLLGATVELGEMATLLLCAIIYI
ncbi:MAG: adenosylcobinamide-GDP ribazoletransferase [Deltaproteobacteria bacterium]|jgi:adenosylcobinamide-GDP ribazoletransferase|nr:adenosylcobinamide-GDP ribazoletransferase [Deltaproteobacteria bacterium]